MKRYKVIWFDDEFKTLNIIREKAFVKGIDLIGFDNSKEGIVKLEERIENYDAAISDGLFFMNPGQSGDSVTDKALFEVGLAMERLIDRKKLPWFILSGQAQFTKERNSFADAFKDNKVYDKLNDDDLSALWEIIKLEADKQPETQIRHDNKELFLTFDLGYLPAQIEIQVLELFKTKLPENRAQIKSILTNIRSIQESCFLQLESIKVIPDSQASLKNIVRHLSGNIIKTGTLYAPTTKQYQNDSIENLHKWIYFTCGKYIHNLKDDNYNDYMISNYAVESLRNGILEILLWFKKTYADNK
jgi:hypothetical protein